LFAANFGQLENRQHLLANLKGLPPGSKIAMSHLFNSGLFFGQNAWHGLGVTLPADSEARYSIDDAIRIAGLDWRARSAAALLGKRPAS
jgi:hypothetical protein